MSRVARAERRVAPGPGAGLRLLRGLGGADVADPSLDAHLQRWGEAPRPGAAVIDEIEASGLVGHGGAWFPVATKWRGVATASRRRPVVVANGAESEPASRKDALLLARAPHLVLDGLALAAGALHAHQAIVYVPSSGMAAVQRAVDEREARHVDRIRIDVAECPHTYLAGQETALVSQLGGKRGPVPSFQGIVSIRERGLGGRPTLVQNAETLAHVALVGRYGGAWFREVGTPETPGTMLLTVTRQTGPVVVEAVLGSSLAHSTGVSAGELAETQGVLLGGYGGGWVSARDFGELPVSEKAARRLGATLGAGVVALLPQEVCPLAEMADVVRYMEHQGAGQCGPCVNGLAEVAAMMEALAYGTARATRPEPILEVCNIIEGRGACRHPDGVVRFVRSGLQVFAEEVAAHQRRGACQRVRGARVLPGTGTQAPPRVTARRAPPATPAADAAPSRRLVSRA